jgi:hypothetical protein
VWILPWALSVDNITYGIVSGVPAHASVWFSAGEQTLSSAVQAGIGLLIVWRLVALFPVLKLQVSLAFAFCGVATLAAAVRALGRRWLTWPAAHLTWSSILTSSAARTRPISFAWPTRPTWPTPSR